MEKAIAVLRFLNLLEPDKTILSISKMFMWMMLFCIVYVLIFNSDNLEAVLAAAGSQLVATANYAFRRQVQYRMGEYNDIGNPYSPRVDPYDSPDYSRGYDENYRVTEQ